ncbi:hypothetical protein M011DRAFT_471942 [Sporormia fimetaria CBS 119925]|uniref:Transcription initiation factor TFIID subunit 8 n=1 Tax=Sporormia fimetaria CBS 119925 TaxID=1340428 RepID=A0A6A6UWW1_9PLEO|nr:hypothetical protein M011DRAFT_471942 [Sporormia fimetaria CBS 119925]
MPGLVATTSVPSTGTTTTMKRAIDPDTAQAPGDRLLKKRKVVHTLRHTQPIEHIHEHIESDRYSAELCLNETQPRVDLGEFFGDQMLRAIAVECRAAGFESARPEALERFRAMVDSYMRKFTAHIRTSMTSARRTSTVPHDWIHALKKMGIPGSSALELHLDTGNVPPPLLQPTFEPPEPPPAPPPDVEGWLGPDLSGRLDKETRKYIPTHMPPFPPKHAWKATPVYTQRESDPRKIREKATEEGIRAEQSLRKLMAAQKAGLQKNKARKQPKSKRMKRSDELWEEAMKDLIHVEEERAEAEKRNALEMDEEYVSEMKERKDPSEVAPALNEGVRINYEQRFWRKSARGI